MTVDESKRADAQQAAGPQAEGPPTGPALSLQQKRFSGGGARKYREFLVGEACLGHFIGFELYNLFLMDLPTVLGLGLRRLTLPLLLKSGGKKAVIGRGVTLRQPARITLGSGVILDDFAVLDYRAEADPTSLEPLGITLEDHVLIGRSSILVAKGGSITLRSGCNVSSHCRIATQSRVVIGESTLVAAYAYIGPGNHAVDDPTRPIIEQDMDIRGGVSIGKNCWIGTRATILDGVTIGDNAVVGAHSLVREDVPANAIVAGAPARVIKIRGALETVEDYSAPRK